MPRVLALTRYGRKGASSRVRFLQYVPHLEKLGWHVTVDHLFSDAYLARLYENRARAPIEVAAAMLRRFRRAVRSADADIVWLQREILPFAPFALERNLLAGRKVVIDFDDAHHLYYKDTSSFLIRALFGDKIERLMALADAVTVGNRTLADCARAAGARRVVFVPSAVDVQSYADSPPPPAAFTVGWIGTPVTAAEALPLVSDPLRRFLAETQSKCLLVGVRPDQAPELAAERVPWSEEGEAAALARISVGLCPLADTPWNRGKSGYKIIQYMAAGKPTLASPVGIASELVADQDTGFHCATPDAWHAALTRLYRDPGLCARMGASARAAALEKYDVTVAAAALARVFTACRDG